MIKKIIWGSVYLGVFFAVLAQGGLALNYKKLNTLEHRLSPLLLQASVNSKITLHCQRQMHWPTFSLHQQCQLVDEQARQWGTITQKVLLTPWQLSGTFVIRVEHEPFLPWLNAQVGIWKIPVFSQKIHMEFPVSNHLQSIDFKEIDVSIFAEVELRPPYQSVVSVHLPDVSLQHQNEQLNLRKMHLRMLGEQQGERYVWDNFKLNLERLQWINDTDQSQFSLHYVQLQHAQLLAFERLSKLVTVKFEQAKYRTARAELRVDDTTLQGYFHDFPLQDNAWIAQFHALFESPLSELPLIYWNKATALLAHQGFVVDIEQLQSGFVFQERTPSGWALSGEVNVSGRLQIDKNNSTDLNVQIELSDSLGYGPWAEMTLLAVDKGWIEHNNQRLHSHLKWQSGTLFANDLEVQLSTLWPTAYDDDH